MREGKMKFFQNETLLYISIFGTFIGVLFLIIDAKRETILLTCFEEGNQNKISFKKAIDWIKKFTKLFKK